MQKWKPLRKIAIGAISAALAYVAKRAGVDLGPEELNEAALAIWGIATAYLVKS